MRKVVITGMGIISPVGSGAEAFFDSLVRGVCGKLERGHIVNVYSEVTITRAAGENCGGICGRIGYGGYVEHCTQNARVSSTESKPDRGGIGGYCPGSVRWCVNMQTVASRWDYVGGIAKLLHLV